MPRAEIFGKYQMLTRIASGGMAEVWLARSSSLGGFEKLLAIKRMHPSLSRHQAFVSMFIDEAKLTVRLAHPNIVQVFDFGRVDDDYYMAMEYVEGVDLSTLAKQAKRRGAGLPVGLCVYIMRAVFDGLAHAHTQGPRQAEPVVHRDVSPQNVLVSFDGHVKVNDFGIAKAVSEIEPTTRGEVFGKLAYVSPEQVRGEPVDEATDLWAAGVVLHELLANRRLFARGSDLETMDAVEGGPIPHPRELNPEVPEDLDALVMAALARDPQQRLRSARKAAETMALLQSKHYPEITQYKLTEHIIDLWDGQLPRVLPPLPGARPVSQAAPAPAPEGTMDHRPPVTMGSVVQQTQRVGAATAGLALSALRGVHQIRADSAWTDEATFASLRPRTLAGSLVDDAAATERAPAARGPAPESREVSRLKRLFVTQPNLWVLVDIGEAWLEAGEPRLALGALKLAAAKFAQRGLLIQAATIYRLMMAHIPLDEPLREEIKRLPSLQGLPNVELLAQVFDEEDDTADFSDYLDLFEASEQPVDVYTESPVLSSLNAEQLVRVVEALDFSRHQPGDAIVKEGDAGDSFFFIGRGRVVVSGADFEGNKLYLTSLSDGDCFGEHGFFTGERRNATIEPVEEVWLLEAQRPTLNRVLQDYPTVRESLRRFYRDRIAESLLAKSPLFSGLDVKQRRHLAARFTFETYQTGDLVIREGDQSDAFYAIKSGQVRVYAGDDEAPTELARLGAGEIFGEIAALEGSRRTASVRALTECELLRLEAGELNAMLAKNLEIRKMIEAQIARRAEAKIQKIIEEA
jgi:serine/threonine protein kinase/CRP-like cAMP-binding protein